MNEILKYPRLDNLTDENEIILELEKVYKKFLHRKKVHHKKTNNTDSNNTNSSYINITDINNSISNNNSLNSGNKEDYISIKRRLDLMELKRNNQNNNKYVKIIQNNVTNFISKIDNFTEDKIKIKPIGFEKNFMNNLDNKNFTNITENNFTDRGNNHDLSNNQHIKNSTIKMKNNISSIIHLDYISLEKTKEIVKK